MAAILAVDNEDIVVDVIRASLEAKGHTLTTACSVAEALQRAARMKRIDVLIINHIIHPRRGRDIAEYLLQSHPNMKVLHVCGWPREYLEAEGSLTPGSGFLEKPFMASQIQAAVAALLPPRPALASKR